MKTKVLKVLVSTVAVALAIPVVGGGVTPRFYPDDPVWVERDHQDASGVQPWEIDLTVDLALNMFAKPGDPAANVRARNLNTVDEVPDSSWFTNRLGHRPISGAEM